MIRTIQDVKRIHDGHFFDAAAMRWFQSRILTEVYPTTDGGAYFVTSERFSDASPRLYTVRQILPDGSVLTVGDFQQYESARSAKAAARALAG